MIIRKSAAEIELMREAGRVSALALRSVGEKVAPGVSTKDLDLFAEEIIRGEGGAPAFLGYAGFPATLCTSINHEVVHGIPSKTRILVEGDILAVDVGAIVNGYVGDNAATYAVGTIRSDLQDLLDITERSLYAAIDAAVPGNRLGDIGHAVQSLAEAAGYGVIREYVGHGIGRDMHEEPNVPNFGTPGTGVRLQSGMVLAIEPMINLGTHQVRKLSDGWTVVTADGKPSAHFEHTVAITDSGPIILTQE